MKIVHIRFKNPDAVYGIRQFWKWISWQGNHCTEKPCSFWWCYSATFCSVWLRVSCVFHILVWWQHEGNKISAKWVQRFVSQPCSSQFTQAFFFSLVFFWNKVAISFQHKWGFDCLNVDKVPKCEQGKVGQRGGCCNRLWCVLCC